MKVRASISWTDVRDGSRRSVQRSVSCVDDIHACFAILKSEHADARYLRATLTVRDDDSAMTEAEHAHVMLAQFQARQDSTRDKIAHLIKSMTESERDNVI